MKTIDVSDEVYEQLQQLAAGYHRTPDKILAALLNVPLGSPEAAEPLAAFVLGAEFRSKPGDADRYLALLGWVASHHPADFSEFIRSLPGRRRFLGLNREEILATCRHNQARQIAGTQYWAIMNLDTPTKLRFLAHALEFVGYREEVIDFACSFIGGGRSAVLVPGG
jgi:negative modulator of initiation of replication